MKRLCLLLLFLPVISGAQFLLNETIRFDPANGNDTTCAVGDPTKPCLTVQGCINKIQAGTYSSPVVDVGNNTSTEDVTTSLRKLTITGYRVDQAGAVNSITLTNTTQIITLILDNCAVWDHVTANNFNGLNLWTVGATQLNDVANNGGWMNLANFGSGVIYGTISAPSGTVVTMRDFSSEENFGIFNAPGAGLQLYNSRVYQVQNASNVSVDYQSQIRNTNNAAANTTYANGVYPVIVGKGRVEGATTNATVATARVPFGFDTSFEVSMNIRVNSVTGSISTSLNCDYTDEGNVTRTARLPVTQFNGNLTSGGGVKAVGVFHSVPLHIRCKANTTITLYTAPGTFNGANYNAEGYIRQFSQGSSF